MEIDVAIGHEESLFLVTGAGVLSPWLFPFIYENRTGRDPVVFADSPVNADWLSQYSTKVDDGVYVYILAAKGYVASFDRLFLTVLVPKVVCLLVIAVGLMIGVVSAFRNRRWALSKTLLAVIGGHIGFGVATAPFRMTCYQMAAPFSRRTPQMVQEQRELLGRFHDNGVLGDAAYRAAIEALENPLGIRAPAAEKKALDSNGKGAKDNDE